MRGGARLSQMTTLTTAHIGEQYDMVPAQNRVPFTDAVLVRERREIPPSKTR